MHVLFPCPEFTIGELPEATLGPFQKKNLKKKKTKVPFFILKKNYFWKILDFFLIIICGGWQFPNGELRAGEEDMHFPCNKSLSCPP